MHVSVSYIVSEILSLARYSSVFRSRHITAMQLCHGYYTALLAVK